ncbi:hypothetical protein Rs2_21540 [Raphanus sativus]|nr:hypothetical protein Rs2_21540 [Raphanus sativus]
MPTLPCPISTPTNTEFHYKPKYEIRAYDTYQRKKRSWTDTTQDPATQQVKATYTKKEVDKMIVEIYEALQYSEDDYYKKLDDISFPFDSSINALHSWTERIDKEIKAIQRQLATRPSPYKSTDMPAHASIDEGSTTLIDMDISESIDTDTPSVR